jgi:hypothetical protein
LRERERETVSSLPNRTLMMMMIAKMKMIFAYKNYCKRIKSIIKLPQEVVQKMPP